MRINLCNIWPQPSLYNVTWKQEIQIPFGGTQMFKLVAQVLVSATVGLAVAAGSDANVRGYIGEALHEPGVYIQESVRAIAHTVGSVSTETNAQTDVNVNVDVDDNASANVDANVPAENTVDVSAQSTRIVKGTAGLTWDPKCPSRTCRPVAPPEPEPRPHLSWQQKNLPKLRTGN